MQKTVKGKLAFDCPVVYLYFGFTPTFDIEPYFTFNNTYYKAGSGTQESDRALFIT